MPGGVRARPLRAACPGAESLRLLCPLPVPSLRLFPGFSSPQAQGLRVCALPEGEKTPRAFRLPHQKNAFPLILQKKNGCSAAKKNTHSA